jgi:hypothetical protein
MCKFQLREVKSHVSVRTTQYSVQMLINQQHPPERRGNTVQTPIYVQKL